MKSGMAVDTSTVLVLAAIALAEGVTRVPAGSLVLRRWLSGPWHVVGVAPLRERLQLIHWWPPWSETLVVPPSPTETASLTEGQLLARVATISTTCRAARLVGALGFLTLVVGIPGGFGVAGAVGGLTAAGCVFGCQVILALLGWRGLALSGATLAVKQRLLVSTLNPFAAPAVGSRLLAAALLGAGRLTVARALLSPEQWATWFRPRAYDAGVAHTPDRQFVHELEAANEVIAQVLAQRPAIGPDVRWCPRCAATYQAGFGMCTDCGIDLLR
jgi:hypothetical protein